LDRTAGSHSLAAAGQRERWAALFEGGRGCLERTISGLSWRLVSYCG